MATNRIATRAKESLPIDDQTLDAMIVTTRPRIARAMEILRRPQARVGVIPSPIGRLLVAESDRGFATIHFMSMKDSTQRALELLRRKFDLIENEPGTRRIAAQVDSFFEGDVEVTDHPVDLSVVDSEFQRRALTLLRKVPAGAVITYHALAATVGQPDSQRAIGNTMASNPIPLYVPCHRVVRSDGTIGNYGGGVDNKIKLLRLEGFDVGRDLRLPSRAVMGHRKTGIYCRPDCSAATRADPSRVLIFADARSAGHAGWRACKLCRPA